MPPRGKAPGLKRNRHGSPYWVAANVARDLKSFPDKCIPLPRDADENTFARLCHEHTASLRAWLDQHASDQATCDLVTQHGIAQGATLSIGQ